MECRSWIRQATGRGDPRDRRDQSCTGSGEEIREVDLLQQLLHDDLAGLVYDRLKRRPMVLPVVVEV